MKGNTKGTWKLKKKKKSWEHGKVHFGGLVEVQTKQVLKRGDVVKRHSLALAGAALETECDPDLHKCYRLMLTGKLRVCCLILPIMPHEISFCVLEFFPITPKFKVYT